MWLYAKCLEMRPWQSLEIGLGYGLSTIYILAAIHEIGHGLHTSIDPLYARFQSGVGPQQAVSVGMAQAFRFIRERSIPAMVDLARGLERFQFIFIDGSHLFDDALADFVVSAEICPPGGVIVLDDMWMTSIQKVAAFIRRNRTDFKEITTDIANIAAFQRVDLSNRPWDFHADF
jgi:predicted O-methyltransferase YrrM